MANDTSSPLEVWIGLVKAFLWPITVVAIILVFRADIIALFPRVNEMTLPGGTSFKLGQAVERLDRQMTKGAGSSDSPSDGKVSAEVKALAEAKQALIASASTSNAALSRTGWIYCGVASGDGKWISPPNLAVASVQKLTNGNTYEVSTDTYLRDRPPLGAGRLKGDVITVIPEGAQVRTLGIQRLQDPSHSDRTLFWVQVEYKGTTP
jgi:hypothetical protein